MIGGMGWAIIVLILVGIAMANIKVPEGKAFLEHNTGCIGGLIFLVIFPLLFFLWLSTIP